LGIIGKAVLRKTNMQIKILFDSERLSRAFSIGWGFSCLLAEKILFDTGKSAESLLANMKSMNVDISGLEAVIISHEHWDHTGGLWELVKMKEGLRVYACSGFSSDFKLKVKALKGSIVEVNNLTEITNNVYTTGEIPAQYKGKNTPEQALVVRTDKGISVITGCSHPGIVKILENIQRSFSLNEFYLVMGGFHLLDKNRSTIKSIVEEFRRMRVAKAGPAHCTGKEAITLFREEYKEDFVSVRVGLTLTV
jgi:7,8-dihydropterin-6-yl-methyl-4-(beta-D-ribofuranosyl)aminobenzene 5'-phosphate synthase